MIIKFLQALLVVSVLFNCGCSSTSSSRNLKWLSATPNLRMSQDDFPKTSEEVEELTITSEGEPGQKFAGEITLDGKTMGFSGVTPFSADYEACVLYGSVKKLNGKGKITFVITNKNDSRKTKFGTLKKTRTKAAFGYHNGHLEVMVY